MAFHIMGTGSALPARQVTNDELARFLDTSDEWISTRTGISSRPVCTTETLGQLAEQASRRALEAAGVNPSDLDLIIVTTCSPEHWTPAQACVLQKDLGATCPAFDLNGACAGFVFGLSVADGFFTSGRARRILVCSAEQLTRCVDWNDRATCVLFGDGAAAVVLGAGGESPLYLDMTTQGDDEAIFGWMPAGNSPFDQASANRVEQDGLYMHMKGREVYKFAVSSIASEVQRLSQQTGVALTDIDHFVFHQANKRIIDAGVERLGIDPSKVIVTIGHTANVSSACIPLSLDRLARAGELKDGDLVALFGFGSGLVTGTCLLRWQTSLPQDVDAASGVQG